MNTKIWLVIIAVMHTVMGVIVSYQQFGNIDSLSMYLYFTVVSVYLLYAAFMTEGQTQARLAAVLCAPVVVWFLISAVMGLEMGGQPVAEMPFALLPIALWTMLALSGIMKWTSA